MLKYFELIVSISCWVIAVLWFRNSSGDDFAYEPAILAIGGLIPLFDSIRRFEIFSKVCLSVRNAQITPWSFSGGKIDKTNVSVELIVKNNKETNLLVRSVVVQPPLSISGAIGNGEKNVRLVDMDKIQNYLFLPINIPAKSGKTIFVESKHDASSMKKYSQASKFGELMKNEVFELVVEYSLGTNENTTAINFSVETSALLALVRSKYEESDDYLGVVKLIERT